MFYLTTSKIPHAKHTSTVAKNKRQLHFCQNRFFLHKSNQNSVLSCNIFFSPKKFSHVHKYIYPTFLEMPKYTFNIESSDHEDDINEQYNCEILIYF